MLISCYVEPPKPPAPKLGEIRKTRKFAWLPTKVYSYRDKEYSDYCTIWLEHYTITEKYEKFERVSRLLSRMLKVKDWRIQKIERG